MDVQGAARDPLIVTALLDPVTQAGLDALRERHFPSDRNHLAAHLTLFHHLDPAGRAEIETILVEEAERLPLAGRTGPPRNLGRGVAIGVDCPELVALRRRVAARVPGTLTRQDEGWGWPHVTVQNKVDPQAARALHATLERSLRAEPLEVVGLVLWAYLGGPWQHLATFPAP